MPDMTLPHLRAAVMAHPWAIMQDRLEAICEVLERRCAGIRLSPEEIAAAKGERRMPNGTAIMFDVEARALDAAQAVSAAGQPVGGQPNVIAVINVMGIIAMHAHEVDDISGPGGTSCERVSRAFRAAVNDPNVKAVLLNIDSPGGSVYGVAELADEILKARGTKPIVAQVNALAASAAYHIASACDEIVMTPSGEAGSIGVYALHQDVSEAAKAAGFKFTFIQAGEFKTEGNRFEPLGDAAREHLQSRVDDYYDLFVKAVAKGRGVSAAKVKAEFGKGRCYGARQCVEIGMADKVGTLDETLRRLGAAKGSSGAKADAETAAEITAKGPMPAPEPAPPAKPEKPADEKPAEQAEQPAADPAGQVDGGLMDIRRRRHALRRHA